MEVRIIVALDVDTEGAEGDPVAVAYRRVSAALGAMEAGDPWIQWESTDEWYGQDGEPVPVDRVEAVRAAHALGRLEA